MAVSVVPMPSMAGSAADQVVQLVVGVRYRVGERVEQVARRAGPRRGRRGGDGHGAGDLAGGVAAHAVGDREQARAGVRRVLVPLAEEADV